MGEPKVRVREDDGKERSSHRVYLKGVYHSSMQCDVWPCSPKTRPVSDQISETYHKTSEDRGHLRTAWPARSLMEILYGLYCIFLQ